MNPDSWFAARGRWQRLGLAMLSGALMTAGHAPVDLPWVLFLAVPALVWLVAAAPSASAALWIGWGAGFGYFVTGLHWVGHAFLVEPERFLLLIPLGIAGLPAGLAIFWALAFWAAKRFWPGSTLLGAIWLAALWSAVEYARGNILTGFPWALPGYVWMETPIIQSVSWAGPYGLTLLTLILTALPGIALAQRAWLPIAATVGAVVGLWAGGMARMPAETALRDEPLIVRLVQPNAPQTEKWVPGRREMFYARAMEATAAPPATETGAPGVVIWPETAVYWLPSLNPDEVAKISRQAGGVPIILGALHAEGAGADETWYNSLFVIGLDGALAHRYDKHHLVPFGEYLPFAGLLQALGIEQFARAGSFGAGTGPETLSVAELPAFAALICYEAIFPDEVVGETRPDWMVQVTNDAWFGSFAGPQQHLDQARIRAIEQGLPMVRAANTGISAVIDPHGRIIDSISLGVSGFVDAPLPAPLPPTLYSRLGDSLALFLIALSAIFPLFRQGNRAQR